MGIIQRTVGISIWCDLQASFIHVPFASMGADCNGSPLPAECSGGKRTGERSWCPWLLAVEETGWQGNALPTLPLNFKTFGRLAEGRKVGGRAEGRLHPRRWGCKRKAFWHFRKTKILWATAAASRLLIVQGDATVDASSSRHCQAFADWYVVRHSQVVELSGFARHSQNGMSPGILGFLSLSGISRHVQFLELVRHSQVVEPVRHRGLIADQASRQVS